MYLPPDSRAFFMLVWEIVKQIPEGEVSTYGQIASMIPPPEEVEPFQYARLGARWVGSAMRAVPDGSDIPWHRVINSQGKISLPAGSSGAEEQAFRLATEGVEITGQELIDLNSYGWDGPSDAWLEAHNLLPPRSLKKKTHRQNDEDNASQMSLF